jgi:hypothetical protein
VQPVFTKLINYSIEPIVVPIAAEPIAAEPIVVPIAAEPIAAEPIAAEPIVVPIAAEPIAAEPIVVPIINFSEYMPFSKTYPYFSESELYMFTHRVSLKKFFATHKSYRAYVYDLYPSEYNALEKKLEILEKKMEHCAIIDEAGLKIREKALDKTRPFFKNRIDTDSDSG